MRAQRRDGSLVDRDNASESVLRGVDEPLALEWSDVDLDGRTVSISKAASWVSAQRRGACHVVGGESDFDLFDDADVAMRESR